MPKYLIERTVPGVGQMDADALAQIAQQSNGVLRDLGPDVQWVHSYVTDDKIVCVYNARSEDIIREHGRCGGFPVDAGDQQPDEVGEWAEHGGDRTEELQVHDQGIPLLGALRLEVGPEGAERVLPGPEPTTAGVGGGCTRRARHPL